MKSKYDPLSQEYNWPRIRWKISLWPSIISLLISASLLIFPNWANDLSNLQRIIIIVLIALIPVLIFSIIPWIIKLFRVITLRLSNYSKLHLFATRKGEELKGLQNDMAEYIQSQLDYFKFEIKMVGIKNDKLYIVINRKFYPSLMKGDILEVLDLKDYMPMGQFIITETRDDVYYAEAIKHIDKLWFGYVNQRGETEFTPDLVAVKMPYGGQND